LHDATIRTQSQKVVSIEITDKLANTFQQTLEPIEGRHQTKRPRLGMLKTVAGPDMAIFTQTGGATEEGGAAADLGDQSFKIVGRVKRQCNLDYVYPDGETETAIQQDRFFARQAAGATKTKIQDPRQLKIRKSAGSGKGGKLAAGKKKKPPPRDNFTSFGVTKQEIKSRVLELFDQHEYWTITEMYMKLELPKASFQPILQELAENVVFEGKQKWHLRAEYR